VKDAQKPDHVSLSTLIGRLKEGRFVIPDFQREFEWEPWDIRDLMRSIFLDYFIGSLLLWKGKVENFAALACEDIYGFDGNGGSPEHIVLDGQQRLTAMYYAFIAPDASAPNRRNRYLYFIRVDRFMDGAYDDAFDYDWTRRGVNLLQNTTAQFESHMFPLAVVGAGGWELPNWVQAYEAHWRGKAEAAESEEAEAARRHADDAREFGEHLRGITEQYQIAYVELDRELAIDKVCDIFTQVNSKGVRLDVFDLINALVKPKGLQLKQMWRGAAPRLEFIDSDRMNVYILQVMSILSQGYCSPKYLYYLLPGQEKTVREPGGALKQQILVSGPDAFRALWNRAVEAIEKAIALLRHPQEFGAISSAYLPYVSILPAFAALQVQASKLSPPDRLAAQRKIRHWYWASVFTARYSGSVESTAARDFLDVTAWFSDDTLEPSLLAEFRARVHGLDLHREIKRGTSVYNGIFNLLVINGARDWAAGTVPQYGDLDDHHIVPKDWGKQAGIGTKIDTILNRTPLTAETNRHVVRDRLPNQYLAELIEANGETAVRATLETHLISPTAFNTLLRDPFNPEDFDEFLTERQKTIVHAIADLLIRARLDLPPDLRDLDAQLEEVELALRGVILERLNGDPSVVPSHVNEKIKDRLETAAKKNPALDAGHYESLAGRLEYFDLRELHDTITNKVLWPQFEELFGTKEQLASRFGQLAELRNGIRHSRSVDDVTRKDGEAALLWFRQVLPARAGPP
jgi:hypothetical protein